ncbi:hypothetical protein A2U01_0084317, partial [Trifolium medium]|nr:hypothetical protein [Trifolium medium]
MFFSQGEQRGVLGQKKEEELVREKRQRSLRNRRAK